MTFTICYWGVYYASNTSIAAAWGKTAITSHIAQFGISVLAEQMIKAKHTIYYVLYTF